jgi:radical SAM protein with 4Fe4S-binding SPASM domain
VPTLSARSDYELLRSPRSARGRLGSAERLDAFGRLSEGHHTVKLHLTSRCNLRCRNCYNDATTEQSLSRAEIFALLAGLRGRPCRLDLLGGEPMLYPDLLDVVRQARTEVGIPSVFLYTNATCIDEVGARQLAAAGLDTAIVSLHGDRAAVHEQLTGIPGSFERTCRGMAALRAAGIRTYTFTVACAVNAGLLPTMQTFAAERGGGALFFPYVPQRRDDALTIADPTALRRTLSFIIRASYVYRSALLRSLGEGCKLCRAFTQTVTVLADGTVTPCPFLALGIGNIRQAPLHEILVASHGHPQLADLLADPEECQGCSIRGVCGGGCRAGRFTVHGDLLGRDLACLHGPFGERVALADLPEHLPYVY